MTFLGDRLGEAMPVDDAAAFEDRYVLYFDFLGTREAATNWPRERLYEFVDLLISISQIQAHEEVVGGAQADGSYRIQITPEITTFSDHVVVSWLHRDHDDIPEAYKYLWPDIILKEAIRITARVAEAALRMGLLLRGGLSVGQLFHDGAVVFGEAMVASYELESGIAKNPRVIVADIVIERLKPMRPEECESLLQDADGYWHLNYFTHMMRNAAPRRDADVGDPIDSLSPVGIAHMEQDIEQASRWKHAHLDRIDREIDALRKAGAFGPPPNGNGSESAFCGQRAAFPDRCGVT
jgi:hypothetical protein